MVLWSCNLVQTRCTSRTQTLLTHTHIYRPTNFRSTGSRAAGGGGHGRRTGRQSVILPASAQVRSKNSGRRMFSQPSNAPKRPKNAPKRPKTPHNAQKRPFWAFLERCKKKVLERRKKKKDVLERRKKKYFGASQKKKYCQVVFRSDGDLKMSHRCLRSDSLAGRVPDLIGRSGQSGQVNLT